MQKLTIGSCFSGIGGLELGLEWTGGFKTKWQIENDPYATAVLAKHWPDVKRYSDIRDVIRPETVDVICGGFPCQPHSVANKNRKGANDERNLWPAMLRLIREVSPRFVIAENVPGIFETGYGAEVLASLEENNYCPTPVKISACSVGAPHPRERVFFVAHTVGERCWPWCQLERSSTHSSWRKEKGEWESSHSDQLASCGCHSRNNRRAGKERWWPAEPRIKRVVDGLPAVLDRLKCIGNAVVPQVAQKVGEMILRYHEREISAPTL